MSDEPLADAVEEGYLRAVLDLRAEVDEYLEEQGLSFRGVYLRSSYPDTELVVKCWSRETSLEGRLVCPVWVVLRIDGKQMPFDTGAGIIATNVMEGIWDWREPQEAWRRRS